MNADSGWVCSEGVEIEFVGLRAEVSFMSSSIEDAVAGVLEGDAGGFGGSGLARGHGDEKMGGNQKLIAMPRVGRSWERKARQL